MKCYTTSQSSARKKGNVAKPQRSVQGHGSATVRGHLHDQADRVREQVHVDDIKYLRRFESATGLVARATKAAAENTKAWEVQHIMGERTVEGGQKQYVYLVKWGLITRGYFSLL